MNINIVAISGHITRDAELRYTQGGTAVLRFGVAVNERRKGSGGKWEDYPNFIDCVRFGESCEWWQQRLTKGTHVTVHGRLHYSSWDKDGERRSKLEIIAEAIDAPAQGANGQPQQQPAYRTPEPTQQAMDVYDEDIPF
jgi:single-strand DNA-binding protein